ncbi:MAG TPA: hypothetical protein VHE35_32385, partial [Kofleriaceae bacterium]|nr:hypothetical protein [Kofleriaceae bacterium]
AAAGALAVALALALAVGNLFAASRYSAPSVRISGGEAAADVLRREIHGRLGKVVAWASRWSNWPARTLFALRYHREDAAYDQVVGVYFLGETFPGLNSTRPRTEDHLTLAQVPGPLKRGFRSGGADGGYVMPAGLGQLYLGLNRRGGVRVAITVWHPDATIGGDVLVRWNGREAARVPVPHTPTPIEIIEPEVRRGVNLLELEAPPGTLARDLDLTALGSM